MKKYHTATASKNVELPLADNPFAWVFTVLLMVLLAVAVWYFFKRRKML